jgi:hypothetical protein
MGRAVTPPFSLDTALLVALGFVACMPPEVEVGRDSTLGVDATAGGRARWGAPGLEAGQPGADGGAPDEPSTGARGGSISAGGGSTLRGGSGGVTGGSGARAGGSSGAGGSAVSAGAGSGPPLGTAGNGVVGTASGGMGAAATGCPTDGNQVEAQVPLDLFCSYFSCPTSLDGAKDYLSRQFQGCPGVHNEVRTGCGLTQVSVTTERQSDAYVFTVESSELVGAAIHSDTPWGPCNVLRYVAGLMPRGCDAATACAFCGPMATCP